MNLQNIDESKPIKPFFFLVQFIYWLNSTGIQYLFKKMIRSEFILVFLLCSSTFCTSYSNSYAQELGTLAFQIPNYKYPMGGSNYIVMTDGVMTDAVGDFHHALVTDQVLFGDINSDGHPDAAVIIFVVYNGIGYWANILYVFLSNNSGPPSVIGGVFLGVAIGQFDLFSFDSEMKQIVVAYVDRQPGQPKAALPTVPTVVRYEIKDNNLVQTSKIIDKTCYNSVTNITVPNSPTGGPPVIPTIPTDCPYRTVLKDGSCVKVSDLCNTWNGVTGDCTSCFYGYKLSGGACIIGDGGSGSGSGSGNQQLKCQFRTVKINGVCVKVSDLCRTWSETTAECTACYNGYKLDLGKCVRN